MTVKAIRKRVVPELDDEFAKDLGEFETLEALRTRVRDDLEHEATHEAERETRGELLKQLASRVTFDVPASLLDREIDRRVEEFVRRLMDQQIDPMKANINWEEFREQQREAAVRSGARARWCSTRWRGASTSRPPTTRSTRRCSATPSAAAGPPPAVRARLEKEGGHRPPVLRAAAREDGRFPAVEGHKDSGVIARYRGYGD